MKYADKKRFCMKSRETGSDDLIPIRDRYLYKMSVPENGPENNFQRPKKNSFHLTKRGLSL